MPHAPRRSGLAFLALALLAAPPALAATGVSLDVSRVELSAQSGTSLNQAVTVQNPGVAGEQAMTVSPYLRDFLLPQSGNAQFLTPGTSKNSLAKWLQFPSQPFTLAPGQKQQVRYTVQVPPNTAPGLYWGVLFFKSDAPNATEVKGENAVSLAYSIDVGQIIYVQVGTSAVDARLSGVGAKYEGGQLNVDATVRNMGSGLLRAAGRAQVVDSRGQVVATLPIEESVALPGYTRTFSGNLGLGLGAGQYQVLIALQYAKGKFFTGQTKLVVK